MNCCWKAWTYCLLFGLFVLCGSTYATDNPPDYPESDGWLCSDDGYDLLVCAEPDNCVRDIQESPDGLCKRCGPTQCCPDGSTLVGDYCISDLNPGADPTEPDQPPGNPAQMSFSERKKFCDAGFDRCVDRQVSNQAECEFYSAKAAWALVKSGQTCHGNADEMPSLKTLAGKLTAFSQCIFGRIPKTYGSDVSGDVGMSAVFKYGTSRTERNTTTQTPNLGTSDLCGDAGRKETQRCLHKRRACMAGNSMESMSHAFGSSVVKQSLISNTPAILYSPHVEVLQVYGRIDQIELGLRHRMGHTLISPYRPIERDPDETLSIYLARLQILERVSSVFKNRNVPTEFRKRLADLFQDMQESYDGLVVSMATNVWLSENGSTLLVQKDANAYLNDFRAKRRIRRLLNGYNQKLMQFSLDAGLSEFDIRPRNALRAVDIIRGRPMKQRPKLKRFRDSVKERSKPRFN